MSLVLRCSLWRLRVCAWLVLFAAVTSTYVETALAKPKVHTVYEGQRLSSIAKRYNVTVEELCSANGISARDPIKPGQKLLIPGTDDGTGSENSEGDKDPPQPAGAATVHVVAAGHTLGAISNRYAVTVGAIEYANDIKRTTPLKVGQQLVIPHKTDKDGAYARKQRLRGHFEEKTKKEADSKSDISAAPKSNEPSWKKYEKPAWRRGYIKIRRYNRYWEGYVIGPENEVLGHASNKINFVMGAKQDGPRIDPELIRLIASVSDKFGGREMRIVSGYRTKSFVAASKHKQGKAIDFSIPGVPNEVLRDYLRTIKGVGVGYYPNSSFVHLDVRGYNSYWVDHAGPGQAPRKGAKIAKKGASDEGDPEDDADNDSGDDNSDDNDSGDNDSGDNDSGDNDTSGDDDDAIASGDAPAAEEKRN